MAIKKPTAKAAIPAPAPKAEPTIIAQEITDRYAIYNGDCIEVMSGLPDRSIDLSIYSPPFCGLYNYSSSERDLSNCRTYDEFFTHYDFVVSEVARLTKPGRISAVHCMDVPKDGANICGYDDFPGDIVRLHVQCRDPKCKASPLARSNGQCGHGLFEMLPRICIWKEPLGVRNRTMSKSLAHRTIVEDSTQANVASADYLIPFRRRGVNECPVVHPNGFLRYIGEREMPAELLPLRGYKGNQIENRYSHWIWRHYASSFWDDIRLSRVLPYKESRDPEDERHVHPLQLDVIERAVEMWSNPGEKVWTPFLGVGSEAYGAVVNGRLAIGAELKTAYYQQAVRNLRVASDTPNEAVLAGEETAQRSVFDFDPAPTA